MVASSIAKAADDGDDAGDVDDGDDALVQNERPLLMLAVAISHPRSIRRRCTLNAATSLTARIVLRRRSAVNRSPRPQMRGNPR